MLDEKLTFLIERQGYLDMFNGIDIIQTWDYVKILCKSFINKWCEKHLAFWMSLHLMAAACPTPLPCNPNWFKKFNAAIGDSDSKKQANLAPRACTSPTIWVLANLFGP
jgi:hypothetical protein